jgi:enterochelin esterase-like enzyme
MRRFEARLFRLLGQYSALAGRVLVALLLAWEGITGLLQPRAAFLNGPLDWTAQAVSIMSVGRITFAQAPRAIGVLDLIIAAALLLLPAFSLTSLLAFLRLALSVLPLFMLRDQLWQKYPLHPSGPGWGLISFAALPAAAFGLCAARRWQHLERAPGTGQLLMETPGQVAARLLRWRRFGLVFGPLVILAAVAEPFVWPRYLKWFHARQEAMALNMKMSGTLLKKSMPPSTILGGRKITTWVYLPPGYDRSTERYPVVYVMHGMPGEVRDCFVKGEIQDVAENLIKARQIRPMIIVGWDAEGPGGPADVTNFLNRPDYRMESFIVRELVPYVDRTYRTIPDARYRAMDGISAGGYAGPLFLFKHPNIWKVASSHNGFYSPEDDAENMTDILGPKGPLWDANDPTKLVKRFGPADDLHLYMDIGEGDDLQPEFQHFAKEVKARGIDVQAHVFPGRHTWAYWSQHFNDSLSFANRVIPPGEPTDIPS